MSTQDNLQYATHLYERLLEWLFIILPSVGIYYMLRFQDPALCVVAHTPHILVTSVASLLSAFMAYISYQSYCLARNRFLRYLTLGFLAFALCYEPHSFLTLWAEEDIRLFLIYGPVSRVVMNGLLLLGVWHYLRNSEPDTALPTKNYWLRWSAGLLALDGLIFWLVQQNIVSFNILRTSLEVLSVLMALLGCVLIVGTHRQRTFIMRISIVAMLYLLQGSLAFLSAKPWNHLWWYAHVITAIGFFLFSYIVLRAYHVAGDLSHVYSLDEMVLALRDSQEKLRLTNQELHAANEKLAIAHGEMEQMAMQDALIGINNRRGFFRAAEREIARIQRQGNDCAVLMLDIDYFKRVNDNYGHDIGDLVLKTYGSAVNKNLRPTDIFARMGGEEFVVMLPDTELPQAEEIAERIRRSIAKIAINVNGDLIHITVSIGVAAWKETENNSLRAMLACADARLYRAKAEGRNQVIGACADMCILPTEEA